MKIRSFGEINAGGGAALFIWLCHAATAAYFYSTAISVSIQAYYWAAGFVMAASIPYAIAAARGKFIPYEGQYIFLGGLLISFTAYLFLPVAKIRISFDSCEYAMKMVLTGTLLFLVGYYAVFGRAIAQRLPVKRFIINDTAILRIPAKLYLIGWLLRMMPRITEFGMSILEKTGMFGLPMRILDKMQGWEISNMLTSYGICAALMIDTYLVFSAPGQRPGGTAAKRAAVARLSIFFFLEVCYSFFSGMAGNIIRPFIFVFLAYIKTRKSLPLASMLLISFFFLFYVVPFTKTFREQYWGVADAKTSINYAKDKLSNEDELSFKRDEVFIRLSNPLEMAAICYEAKKEGRLISTYQGLDEYFSRFIPRFLWPSKPTVDYNRIGREIGLLHQNDFGTSVALTFVGGLIMDGGTSGVLIGMFILGILISILWSWLIVRSNENIFAFVIYCTLIYRLIFPDDFYVILHSMAAFIVYAYFLSAFVNRRHYKSVRISGQS